VRLQGRGYRVLGNRAVTFLHQIWGMSEVRGKDLAEGDFGVF